MVGYSWLLSLFKTFGNYTLTLVHLFCDSKSGLYIASNVVFHERTKHIDIDYHIVREKLQLGIITTQHIASTDHPADIITKSLTSTHLLQLLSKLSVSNMFQPSNLRGDVTDIEGSQATESKSMTREKLNV